MSEGVRITCDVCPRHCRLAEGQLGACGARRARDGATVSEAYGRLTSVALDPIEKKPLRRFMPGSLVLSVGGYGCTMHCPFCQNHRISQAGEGEVRWRAWSAEELVTHALELRERDPRVVGIAYTYNEPLVMWEFVRDAARLAREVGLVNVLVSSGCVEGWVVREVAPLIDAANIDLKGFTEELYRWCGGDLATAKRSIELLVRTPGCHVEVTTLVIPGVNDSDGEVAAMAAWLASLDPDITYHVTRFHGAYRLSGWDPTPVETVYRLAGVARERLPHVYTGNC